MNILKRTAAAEPGAGAAPAEKPTIDLDKFRSEIQDQNKAMQDAILDTVKTTVQDMLEASKDKADDDPAPVASSKFQAEFAAEMEELGLDDAKAQALTSFFVKNLKKLAPGIKKEIIDDVDERDVEKTKRQEANVRVAQQYPDITQNSPLRKRANEIFKNYSKGEKDSPDGMAHAVREAAAELGIAPLSREQIRATTASNPTGDPAGGGNSKSGPSQADYDFAASFGVKKELFAEKLKQAQAQRRVV